MKKWIIALIILISVVSVVLLAMPFFKVSNPITPSEKKEYSTITIEDLRHFSLSDTGSDFLSEYSIVEQGQPEPGWFVVFLEHDTDDMTMQMIVRVDNGSIVSTQAVHEEFEGVGIPTSVIRYIDEGKKRAQQEKPIDTPIVRPPPSTAVTSEWASPIPAGVAYFPQYAYGVKWGKSRFPGEDIVYEGDILAACTGTIIRLDNNGDRNEYTNAKLTNRMTIDCGGDIYVRYQHYYYRDIKPGIRVGQRVSAGTPLARVGDQGDARDPHLHLQIRTGDEEDFESTYEPFDYLRSRGVMIE